MYRGILKRDNNGYFVMTSFWRYIFLIPSPHVREGAAKGMRISCVMSILSFSQISSCNFYCLLFAISAHYSIFVYFIIHSFICVRTYKEQTVKGKIVSQTYTQHVRSRCYSCKDRHFVRLSGRNQNRALGHCCSNVRVKRKSS